MSLDIRTIQIDLPDEWVLSRQSAKEIEWKHNPGGVILWAGFTEPALPESIYSSDDAARSFSRRVAAERGAGILQVERFSRNGTPGLWLIDKCWEERAATYVSHLIMPFGDTTLHTELGIMETGMTGVRDTHATITLLTRGELKIREYAEKAPDGSIGKIDGWEFDPYDPEYDGIIMNTLADSEEWDSELPNHPLSWLRTFMKELPDRITLPR